MSKESGVTPKDESKILKASVKQVQRIASRTYHVRLAGDDLKDISYIPGYTVNVFLGNPHLSTVPDRKYSIWNYEPVHGSIDLAVCIFSKGPGAAWFPQLKKNDEVYFMAPRGKLILDDSGDTYYLIGNVTSLAHLYEINRSLPVGKTVHSLIYVYEEADLFPDLDGSFPLEHRRINPLRPASVVEELRKLKETEDSAHKSGKKGNPGSRKAERANGRAYITGEPETCIALHDFFVNELGWSKKQLFTKPFWKE